MTDPANTLVVIVNQSPALTERSMHATLLLHRQQKCLETGV